MWCLTSSKRASHLLFISCKFWFISLVSWLRSSWCQNVVASPSISAAFGYVVSFLTIFLSLWVQSYHIIICCVFYIKLIFLELAKRTETSNIFFCQKRFHIFLLNYCCFWIYKYFVINVNFSRLTNILETGYRVQY